MANSRSPIFIAGVVLALLTLAGSGCLRPAKGRAEGALAAERQRIQAMIAADEDAMNLSMHESLTYVHSNGRVDSKTSLVAGIVAGRVNYRVVEPQDPEIRVRGDVAIITARVRMEVAADSEIYRLSSVYTAAYWYEAGRWQLVAYQSSPAGSP